MAKEKWKGIGKLIEECGEVTQVLGKLIAFPTDPHPDGLEDLKLRAEKELADLQAAINYFIEENKLNKVKIGQRRSKKFKLFKSWSLSGIIGCFILCLISTPLYSQEIYDAEGHRIGRVKDGYVLNKNDVRTLRIQNNKLCDGDKVVGHFDDENVYEGHSSKRLYRIEKNGRVSDHSGHTVAIIEAE